MNSEHKKSASSNDKKKTKAMVPFKVPSRLPVWLVLVIGIAIGWWLSPTGSDKPEESSEHVHAESAAEEAPQEEIWTCSMHPQIQLPSPGLCPICNMKLIPLQSGGAAGPTELHMTEAAVALAEIQTSPVVRREVSHEVFMVGKIAYDETRVAAIPAWFAGRIDRIFVDSTDIPVKAGDHLVALYSPDLYSAEKDFLAALGGDPRLEAAARGRLRLLGMKDDQIEALRAQGSPNENETVFASIDGVVVHKNALLGRYVKEGELLYTIADLRQVWLELEAYETDLPWIRFGQDVEFKVAGWPGETFHGRIALISPVLDERSRSIRVRVHVNNEDRRLRPGMFVQAKVQAILSQSGKAVDPQLANLFMCPMHPEVQSEEAGACPKCGMELVPARELGFVADSGEETPLVIPSTAPLLTGRRAVVYVRKPGKEPHFEGRTITLGPRAGEWYVVYDGLMEGDLVVTKGAFRIDAELQLGGKSSMMSPEGGGKPAHQHGAMKPGQPMPAMPAMLPHEMEVPRMTASDAFRSQLGVVVTRYLVLQQALAADDLKGAHAAVESLRDTIREMPHDGVMGPAHEAWMKVEQGFIRGIDDLVGAEDLATARHAFIAISHATINAFRRFGPTGTESLNVAFCPMANEDKGADWIQQGDAIRNPYFGSEMLQCGEVVLTLDQE